MRIRPITNYKISTYNKRDYNFKQPLAEQLSDSVEISFGKNTSASSVNAFVVKYANRTQQETAKRILRASVATIEHILPDSKGGKL